MRQIAISPCTEGPNSGGLTPSPPTFTLRMTTSRPFVNLLAGLFFFFFGNQASWGRTFRAGNPVRAMGPATATHVGHLFGRIDRNGPDPAVNGRQPSAAFCRLTRSAKRCPCVFCSTDINI